MSTPTTCARAREEQFFAITTLKGHVILLDAFDAERLPSGHLNINNGYARIERWSNGVRMHLLLHRFVMGLVKGDGKIVDHINGNRLDNRRANLRLVSRSLNSLNKHIPYVTNTTGFLGVHMEKRRTSRPFRAGLVVNGKKVPIGYFATPEEAHAAYVRAKEPLICGGDHD